MSSLCRARTGMATVVALLTFALSSPLSVTAQEQVFDGQTLAAQEQIPALAPDPSPSWEEASGYQSVEASRVDMAVAVAPVAVSGDPAVEANRVLTAQQALVAGDLGSMQEEALLAVVATSSSWDEVSGYRSVEVSRATAAFPATLTALSNQVPSDARWAPAGAIAPGSPDGAFRVLIAKQALLTGDLGSLQEAALLALVAASMSWDETSGYGELEASRAMSPYNLPAACDLGAALATGTRAETAHLATIPLPIGC